MALRPRLKPAPLRLFAGLVAASVLAAPFALAQTATPTDFTAVSANEARELGLEAIRLGRPDIAAEIALALLEKDKTDSFAHFLMANSLMRLQEDRAAETAAKQSYRYAKTPEQSYQSAHLAAGLAFRRGALITSQWWLRQAAEAAPDTARENTSIAEFRAVKARNPWRIKLAFSARPSDNVNNGSSGQYNIIDGLPYVGRLSEDAQAVKGVVTEVAADIGYRLRKTAVSETSVGAEISARRVKLASAEKARLGGDPGFGSDRVALLLRQDWLAASGNHRFSLEGKVGRQSYQSGRDYSFFGLTFGHRAVVGAQTVLDSAAEVEQRSKEPGQRGDRNFGIRSTVIHQRGNDDLIVASLLASRYDTAAAGRSSTLLGAQIGYTLAKPVGPLGLSGTLGLQNIRYNGYTLAGITVPGGRSDKTGYAELQFQFTEISYAGFAPELRLRHQRTTSNVSRFKANETSLTLGLASKF